MMELLAVVVVAILIESAVETFNTLFKNNGKLSYKKIGAIILSIAVCVCAKLDLFSILGITMVVPYVGEIVTVLVVSRGSGVVNSLIEKLMQLRSSKSTQV